MINERITQIIDSVRKYEPALYSQTIDFKVLDPYTVVGKLNDNQLYLLDFIMNSAHPKYYSIDLRQMSDERLLELFSYRLQHFMIWKWYDRIKLASACETSTMSISRYINGKTSPSILMVNRMANVLGCSVTDLWVEYDLLFKED